MSEPTSKDLNGPLPLRLAVLALWIEAAALLVLAIVEAIKIFTSNPTNPGMAAIIAVILAGVGILNWQLGLGLVHRRAWPRGVAIVVQLSALPVAWFMTVGDSEPLTRVGGVVLGLYCLATAGCLLAPSSRLALRWRINS